MKPKYHPHGEIKRKVTGSEVVLDQNIIWHFHWVTCSHHLTLSWLKKNKLKSREQRVLHPTPWHCQATSRDAALKSCVDWPHGVHKVNLLTWFSARKQIHTFHNSASRWGFTDEAKSKSRWSHVPVSSLAWFIRACEKISLPNYLQMLLICSLCCFFRSSWIAQIIGKAATLWFNVLCLVHLVNHVINSIYYHYCYLFLFNSLSVIFFLRSPLYTDVKCPKVHLDIYKNPSLLLFVCPRLCYH